MIPPQQEAARGNLALQLALGSALALLLWTAQRTLGAAVLFVAAWILGNALPPGPARRTARALLVVILLLWILHAARWVVYPLIAGLLAAFVLAPTVTAMTRRGLRRPLAIALSLLPIGVLAGLALVLLVPALARQIEFVIDRLPAVYEFLSGKLAGLQQYAGSSGPAPATTVLPDSTGWSAAADSATVAALPEGTSSALGQMIGQAQNLLRAALGKLSGVGRGLGRALQWLGLLLLTPVVAWHLLADEERLRATVVAWVPARWHRLLERLARDLQASLCIYVRGQVLVALVEVVLFSIVFAIAGIPQPIALGLLAGLFSLIPVIGFWLTAVLVVLNALTTAAPLASLVKAGIGLALINTVEGQFLVPRIQGSGLGLHPLAVLLGVLLFGTLFGFAGMLLAVPVMGVIRGLLPTLLAEWRSTSSFQAGSDPAGEDGTGTAPPGA